MTFCYLSNGTIYRVWSFQTCDVYQLVFLSSSPSLFPLAECEWVGWKLSYFKDIHILIPRTCQYCLTLKKCFFTHVIKLMILRWGEYPALSMWVLKVITSIVLRRRSRDIWPLGPATKEAEIGVMRPQTKDYGSRQKLDEARTDSPLDSQEGVWPRWQLDFSPLKLIWTSVVL